MPTQTHIAHAHWHTGAHARAHTHTRTHARTHAHTHVGAHIHTTAAKEPRLLAQDPALLLRYLETFSSTLYLAPHECVAFAVRNSSLIVLGLTKVRARGCMCWPGQGARMGLPVLARPGCMHGAACVGQGRVDARGCM